jgi:hypothetical protein
MKFLKENFSDALRIYVNQIGISIFYFALIFPLNEISGEGGLSPVWDFLVSLFTICFFYVLVYYAVWEVGAKDKIRIDSGRYEATPAKGALLGIIANIPNLLFSLPLFVFASIRAFADVCNNAFGIFNTITRFHEVYYAGLLRLFFDLNSGDTSVQFLIALFFLLLPLCSVGVTAFAYYMGSHEKRILYFLPQKPNKK